MWRRMGAFASFGVQTRGDEGGKFLSNRPTPLRGPRHSCPPWPAGARARELRPATRTVRELQVAAKERDSLAHLSRGASQPGPQMPRRAGAGLRGSLRRRRRSGPGSGAGVAGASGRIPLRDAHGGPRSPEPASGRSKPLGRI